MKNTIKHFTLLFLLLNLPLQSLDAENISGRVISSKDNSPIPFVSIAYNDKLNLGTTSNIDGFFIIPLSDVNDDSIHFSCLSYRDTIIKFEDIKTHSIVHLKEKTFEITEVNIVPEDNPAFAILKKVHKNRRLNNPENIDKFKCKEYSQTILKFDISDVDENSSKKLQRLAKGQKDKDALFFETIYQRNYDKTKSHSLKIEASRFPGAKETPIYFPTDFIQPFHFYEDYILLSEKKYLNPIGDRNFSRYDFFLKDSLVIDGIQSYIIDYRPKSELRYEGLEGTLIISASHWAIKSVTAKPYRSDNITISILQNYVQIEGQWFPLELNYELRYEGLPNMTPFSYIGKSYINDVEFGSNKMQSTTTPNYIDVLEGAAERDSIYWDKNRPITLNQRQISTYQNIDTIVDFDKFPFIIEKLSDLKIPVSVFDIDLEKLYAKNDFEGYRIGIGASTNERLSERFSVGGFLLYGSEDKEFKYSANLEANISKKTNFKTYLSYNHSYLKEEYFHSKTNSTNIAFPSSNYNRDFITEYKVGFKNTLRRLNLNYYAASQAYKTYSARASMNALTEEILTGGIHLDFDYYRKNMSSWISPYKSINATSIIENRYIPSFELLFEKGIKFNNYNYDFEKMQVQFKSSFNLTKLGRIHYCLQSGKIWGELAVAKLFRGGEIYAKEATLLFADAFQTVEQNECSNSEYIHLFINYKFGAISFKSKYFLPQVVLFQNLGYGKDNDSFVFLNTQPMDKLLIESGFGVENIFRVSLLNTLYLGGGAAVFCRYGEHAVSGGIEENLTYKALLTISF